MSLITIIKSFSLLMLFSSHVPAKSSIRQSFKRCATMLATTLSLAIIIPAHATIVQFQTVAGNFEVNLLDNETPITVQNFLDYIEAGAYENSIIHRSPSNFVVQGGAFIVGDDDSEYLLDDIESQGSIANEPKYSNRVGTIAMARVQGEVDSATSSWFINMTDNSTSLDYTDEGFTVFGYVISPGMEVVENINNYPIFNVSSFPSLPLIDYDNSADPKPPIEKENLVIVQNIVVIDANPDTAEGHNLSEIVAKPPTGGDSSSEGAGSLGIWGILLLMIFAGLNRKTSR